MTTQAVAVITGGSNGIGAATARLFASRGYAVAVLDVNQERGETMAAALSAGGGAARFYACDVSDAKAVDAVAVRVEKDLGLAEILVTSAGLIPNTESVMDMDLEAHDRMWKVNYNGTIHACRSFGRQMIAQKRGAIVTLARSTACCRCPCRLQSRQSRDRPADPVAGGGTRAPRHSRQQRRADLCHDRDPAGQGRRRTARPEEDHGCSRTRYVAEPRRHRSGDRVPVFGGGENHHRDSASYRFRMERECQLQDLCRRSAVKDS